MSKSHYEVLAGLRDGKEYTGCNVFVDNGIAYSYGRHFPLVVRRDAKSNLETHETWYLLNGDKYSISTSKHQSYTYQIYSEYPRVSFTALSAAGIDYRKCKIVDWVKDDGDFAWPEYENFENFKQDIPIGAEYHEDKDKDGNIVCKSYHKIGGAVLKQDDKYFICGMDEASYFISLLPCPVSSIAEAYQVLQPIVVQQAIMQGIDVKRQGEWFFIPRSDLKIPEKKFMKSTALPPQDSQSNQHIVTRLCAFDNVFFCKGTVRHVSPISGRRADHRRVKLEGVHIAICNTAKGNWSAGGRVD